MGRIYTILLILLVIFLIILILNRRVNRESGKKIASVLKSCDKRYDEFISKKINEHIIQYENFDLDKEQMASSAMELLVPQAETIISYINAAKGTEMSVGYSKGFFPNVASLSEHLFLKKQHNRYKELKSEDEERVFSAFKDSIKADISERIFALKAG